MFEFTRIRTLLDVVSNPKRYRNPDDTEVDLEETANPKSWRDETRATLRERLASRKRQAILFGYFGFVILGLVAFYSPRYASGLTGNPLLIEAVKWAVIVPMSFWLGTRAIRKKLDSVDWLIMLKANEEEDVNGLGFFVGSRAEDEGGNETFQPVKGFSLMGLRGHKVTLGDLGDDFAQLWSKQGREASEPAVIRLDEALYQDRDTFIGSVTAVLTSGLEEDEFGRDTDIYTGKPALVDPGRYRKLSLALTDYERSEKQLKEELDSVKDDRNHWRKLAKQNRKEIRKEIVKTHGELAQSGFAPRRESHQRTVTEGEAIMNGAGGDD